MKHLIIRLGLLALIPLAIQTSAGQDVPKVTLRFVSFPKSVSPQPVDLLLGEGKTLTVKAPSNAISEPYTVDRMTSWTVGKLEPATEEKSVNFTSYGSAPSIGSDSQLILLIRKGKQNSDGMRVVVLDNQLQNFGGGKFFLMNAAKIDLAGVLGGTKFMLKPNQHVIIEPVEMSKREGAGPEQVFTQFFFRKESEAKPFFSSTWPANKKARSMVFFYHDANNDRLRMHTIRDFIP